ncbi:MAG: hypothetical protein ABF289_10805 [Clostridiales bacterium]
MVNKKLKDFSISDVLDYSIVTFKNNFKSIIFFTLIYSIPIILLITLFKTIFAEYPAFSFIVSSILIIMFLMFIYPLYRTILINIIYKNIVDNEEIGIKEIFKISIKKYFNVFLNYIIIYLGAFVILPIYFVILFFTLITFIATIFIIAVIELSMGIPPIISSVLVFIFLILVPAPLMYVIFRVSFTTHYITIENEKPLESFLKSFRLTRKGFLTYYFSSTIIYAFYFIFFGMVYGVIEYLKYYYISNNIIIYDYIANIFLIVLFPLITSLSSILFIGLKIKNEGFDLEMKIKTYINNSNKKDNFLEINQNE